jgi:HSP20 family protein
MMKRIHPVIRVRGAALETRSPDLDGGWVPRLDLAETEKALVVAMEASGLAAEDILISLQPNRIEIKGRKRESAVPPGARYLRLEREYGPFGRSLALPRSVVPAKARASLRNGVLTIVLPKPPISRTRRVVPITKTTE